MYTNSKLDVLLKRPPQGTVPSGGIDLPKTGNIVISGKYGKGKTTLAFQLAAACAEQGHIAIYFSLESRARDVLRNYADTKYVCPPGYQTPSLIARDPAHDQTKIQQRIPLGDNLTNAIINASQPDGAGVTQRPDRLIFVEPSNLATMSKKELRDRIKEIFERLITNAPATQENETCIDLAKKFKEEIDCLLILPDVEVEFVAFYTMVFDLLISIKRCSLGSKVKMVVIDSLTEAFSTNWLKRFDIHRFMNMFKAIEVLGIFPIEDRTDESDDAARFVNDMKYLADCVINLSSSKYGDYEQTCIEVEKNRTAKHVLGKHLYKIVPSKTATPAPVPIAKRCLDIFPSLHYEFTTLSSTLSLVTRTPDSNLLGDPAFEEILPQSLTKARFATAAVTMRTAQVLTLAGKSGLYKSDIAINSLLYGVLRDQNGLIIRLNDNETFGANGVRLNENLWQRFNQKPVVFTAKSAKSVPGKYELKCWEVTVQEEVSGAWTNKTLGGKLFEIVFAKGAIQPEEWLSLLMDVVKDQKINRAALVDLRFIGVSYRFLVSNETSADMLLPTFTQMMKVNGVDLIYAASDSGIEASNREVLRARNLANASILFEQSNGVKLSGTFDVIQNQSHGIRLRHDEKAKLVVDGIDHELPVFSIG